MPAFEGTEGLSPAAAAAEIPRLRAVVAHSCVAHNRQRCSQRNRVAAATACAASHLGLGRRIAGGHRYPFPEHARLVRDCASRSLRTACWRARSIVSKVGCKQQERSGLCHARDAPCAWACAPGSSLASRSENCGAAASNTCARGVTNLSMEQGATRPKVGRGQRWLRAEGYTRTRTVMRVRLRLSTHTCRVRVPALRRSGCSRRRLDVRSSSSR